MHEFYSEFVIQVIFSDEKKFNLDGPDGERSYWRDLRKEPQFFKTRNFGGGSVMVWGAFNAMGRLQIRFTSSKMKSADYIEVLKASLLPFCRQFRRIKFVYQQDNAAIHTSRETKHWFEQERISVLDWPAISPDLNPMENLWAIMVHRIYANNRQFATVNELKDAIQEVWASIEMTVIGKLVASMNNRIFQVIQRSGDATDY